MSDRGAGYFVLLPELAGHWQGRQGDADLCVFDTWLGDDVVRAHPLLLVATPVKQELEPLQPAGGFTVGPVRCETKPRSSFAGTIPVDNSRTSGPSASTGRRASMR